MRKKSPSELADRLVLVGGFISILCTGFYGAEPPAVESLSSLRTIPYIQPYIQPYFRRECIERVVHNRSCGP